MIKAVMNFKSVLQRLFEYCKFSLLSIFLVMIISVF